MNPARAALGCLALTAMVVTACSSSSSPSSATDAGGQGTDTSTPSEGGGHDTWDNFAKGFFSTYCVECHSATIPDPSKDPNQNFNLYSDVVGLDKTIRCGVAPAGHVQSGCPTGGAFPPPAQFPISDAKGTNPKPSDPERLRIIAWINAGAPQD